MRVPLAQAQALVLDEPLGAIDQPLQRLQDDARERVVPQDALELLHGQVVLALLEKDLADLELRPDPDLPRPGGAREVPQRRERARLPEAPLRTLLDASLSLATSRPTSSGSRSAESAAGAGMGAGAGGPSDMEVGTLRPPGPSASGGRADAGAVVPAKASTVSERGPATGAAREPAAVAAAGSATGDGAAGPVERRMTRSSSASRRWRPISSS